MRLPVLLFLLASGVPALSATLPAMSAVPFDQHVVKLVAIQANGMRELGSAVVLSENRLVTNCHVITAAARIEFEFDGVTRTATASTGDSYRDLCFLDAPGLARPPVPMVELGETRVGLDVVAAGYSGGEFAVHRGRIVGLHTCECDGGRVIQTSARFDRGASGGGLFDAEGRLIGILTFKSRDGGSNFHFAVPVGWLRHITGLPRAPLADRSSFWTRAGKESGYFLAACSLGERKDWPALARLAEEWRTREPHNPEAWMATGRAHRGLGNYAQAQTDFQRVLMLDSTHAEAQWAVQEMELLTGRADASGNL